MSSVVVSEFITLDGVVEDPGGAEGFEHGGWAFKVERGPEGDKFKLDETLEADALLLGRRTYEGFAKVWPEMSDEAGFADKMNGMPKYVATSTLDELSWSGSERLEGDVAEAVSRLKQEDRGDMLVAGSVQLAQALLEHDLVDELRLMIYPIVLGGGKRLFADGGPPKSLQLVESRAVGDGVLIAVYRPA